MNKFIEFIKDNREDCITCWELIMIFIYAAKFMGYIAFSWTTLLVFNFIVPVIVLIIVEVYGGINED